MSETAPINPLLTRIRVPGETFRLPSHGVFYTNGQLDPSVKNGEVVVNPMSTTDEIILSTPDKLLSGDAIREIFARCIPQVKDPDLLLSSDVDFLMVCLRMVSFGRDMEVLYKHDCADSQEHTYSINLEEMIRGASEIDPTTFVDSYTHNLSNGQIVKFQPLTYKDVVELYQKTALLKNSVMTEDSAKSLIVDTLFNSIIQVDEVTNRDFIYEWIIDLPLGMKRSIEERIQQGSKWGVDFITKHKCKDCNETMDIFISPNPVNFFI